MGQGPLFGLRVVDLTDDTGRFATKLLAESGASVVRAGRGSPGPAMREPQQAALGGLLDWWHDGGKQRVDIDLDTERGRDAYRRLASAADLVIDTEAPGRLAELGLDHAAMSAANPALVQVSLTPFGLTGPRAHWQTSDLVAGALGGVLSVSGTSEHPLGAWGRQNLNFGSLMAALCGLAGVYAARETGTGQHVDLSLHETVATSIEQIFFQHWFDDILTPGYGLPKRALRQGSLHWLGAYVVAPAGSGACMVTTSPSPLPFLEWMAEEGDPEGVAMRGMTIEAAIPQMGRVMAAFKRFARTRDSGEIFQRAQALHVAFGEVQTVAQVAANPQYEYRGTFREVSGAPGVRMPGPLAAFHGTPSPPPSPPAASSTTADDVLAGWGPRTAHARNGTARSGPYSSGKPLDGVRIVDFTWVLAGPFCCRMLGDLGADVIKFQTAERATLVNSPDFPYFYVWNRSKRSASLNMKHEQAVGIIRRIIEQSDVLIENFSAGVLDRWGIGYDTVKEWNPGIIYVTMSGAGHDGPWSRMITYAPTIHALCGLTHLTNPTERRDVGPGFSLNDHAAGFMGAIAVLSALEARRSTGVGQHVDIAQMETGTYMIGPALLDYFANGREAQPNGNVDPFAHTVPNEVFRAGDLSEVAITCRDDGEWQRLCDVIGPLIAHLANDPGCATAAGRSQRMTAVNAAVGEWVQSRTGAVAVESLQAVGVPAGLVQDGAALMNDPQLVARGLWRSGEHQFFGARPYDRFPGLWSSSDLEPYLLSPGYVGEHNFDIFTELGGMSEEAIAVGMGDELFG